MHSRVILPLTSKMISLTGMRSNIGTPIIFEPFLGTLIKHGRIIDDRNPKSPSPHLQDDGFDRDKVNYRYTYYFFAVYRYTKLNATATLMNATQQGTNDMSM